MQRHTIKISVREQYKEFPLADHLALFSLLHDKHEFTLVGFKRKRDNYQHSYKYELKFERRAPRPTNRLELRVLHDGYFDSSIVLSSLETWLSLPEAHNAPPGGKAPSFGIEVTSVATDIK